ARRHDRRERHLLGRDRHDPARRRLPADPHRLALPPQRALAGLPRVYPALGSERDARSTAHAPAAAFGSPTTEEVTMLRRLATSALVVGAAVLAATVATAGRAVGPPPQVTICHQPGTPAEKTLSLPKPAADAQIVGHVATLGGCGVRVPCSQPATPAVPAPTDQPVDEDEWVSEAQATLLGGSESTLNPPAVATLGDAPAVQQTVLTGADGSAQLVDLPDRTFNLTATADGNRIATLPMTVFDGTAILRLHGFAAASPIDNNDLSLGLEGWSVGTSKVCVVPHVEGPPGLHFCPSFFFAPKVSSAAKEDGRGPL